METISKNLETLRVFHTIATEQNITKAAVTLGCSKSMVTKQIQRLESLLGTLLFYRTTRTIDLTPEGKALFNYSQQIFNLSDEATKKVTDIKNGITGLMRISIPVSLGQIMVPEILPILKRVLPEVEVEFDLSNDPRQLNKDEVDFALRAKEIQHPDLVARYIGRIKDVICASPSYLEKNKPIPMKPKDLTHHECILYARKSKMNTWTMTSDSEDIRIEAKGRVSTNQYSLARQFCLAGEGIARIPLYFVSKDIESGNLIPLFKDYTITTHPLYLTYLKQEYTSRRHSLTKDILMQWLRMNAHYFEK